MSTFVIIYYKEVEKMLAVIGFIAICVWCPPLAVILIVLWILSMMFGG
ncbi:MAG: hypothetical protein BWY36_00913 [Candidatus Diapherotrites archaeon ADurb.Bin253]|nr:MAG: hypothetical protein BWY36_00913 [Candidatus Diapherotrites archaeon ADurb.Bin253]